MALARTVERAVLAFNMADRDREVWDARYGSAPGPAGPAPAWLTSVEAIVPRHGCALDIAAGAGAIATWAAERGLSVLAIDISAVGLSRIAHPGVTTQQQDLELAPTLPEACFALVTLFNYRQPSLAAAVMAALQPGGVLLAELATVKNLERHARPSRRWLVQAGELLAFAQGLRIVSYAEDWHDGRHTARLVAQKS